MSEFWCRLCDLWYVPRSLRRTYLSTSVRLTLLWWRTVTVCSLCDFISMWRMLMLQKTVNWRFELTGGQQHKSIWRKNSWRACMADGGMRGRELYGILIPNYFSHFTLFLHEMCRLVDVAEKIPWRFLPSTFFSSNLSSMCRLRQSHPDALSRIILFGCI